MVPQNDQKLKSEVHVKLMEEDDDVRNIWHNWEA